MSHMQACDQKRPCRRHIDGERERLRERGKGKVKDSRPDLRILGVPAEVIRTSRAQRQIEIETGTSFAFSIPSGDPALNCYKFQLTHRPHTHSSTPTQTHTHIHVSHIDKTSLSHCLLVVFFFFRPLFAFCFALINYNDSAQCSTHIRTHRLRKCVPHICESMCPYVCVCVCFSCLSSYTVFLASIYCHFGKLIACSYSKVKTTNYFASKRKSIKC